MTKILSTALLLLLFLPLGCVRQEEVDKKIQKDHDEIILLKEKLKNAEDRISKLQSQFSDQSSLMSKEIVRLSDEQKKALNRIRATEDVVIGLVSEKRKQSSHCFANECECKGPVFRFGEKVGGMVCVNCGHLGDQHPTSHKMICYRTGCTCKGYVRGSRYISSPDGRSDVYFCKECGHTSNMHNYNLMRQEYRNK